MLGDFITALFQDAMHRNTRWFTYWIYGIEIAIASLMAVVAFSGFLFASYDTGAGLLSFLVFGGYAYHCCSKLREHRRNLKSYDAAVKKRRQAELEAERGHEFDKFNFPD